MDVHILRVERCNGVELPKVEAINVRRFRFRVNQQVTAEQQWGASRQVAWLAVRKRESGSIKVELRIDHGWGTHGSGRTIRAEGDAEFIRTYSRRRGSPRNLQCIYVPWDQEPEELEPWSAEGYANWMAQTLMDRGGRSRSNGLPECVARLPLARLLDAPRLVAFREWAAERTRSGDTLRARLAAADPEALKQVDRVGAQGGRASRHSLALAFVQFGDPVHRGQAGWMLCAPETDALSMPGRARNDFIAAFHEDVTGGEAILPGDDAQRRERRAILEDLVATTRVGIPLLVLAGAAASILLVALIARRTALRLAV